MKIQLFKCISLTIASVLLAGGYAFAQGDSQFDQMIQGLHNQRAQMESSLGLDPTLDTFPQATCYYDDLVDHYEADQIKSDFIASHP